MRTLVQILAVIARVVLTLQSLALLFAPLSLIWRFPEDRWRILAVFSPFLALAVGGLAGAAFFRRLPYLAIGCVVPTARHTRP